MIRHVSFNIVWHPVHAHSSGYFQVIGDVAHYGDLPLETVSVQFVPIAFFYESVRISILGIFAMPVYDITVNAYGILQIL